MVVVVVVVAPMKAHSSAAVFCVVVCPLLAVFVPLPPSMFQCCFYCHCSMCCIVQGPFKLFDLNMKPNMTGPGRPGRDDQDSLVCMAAAAHGWSFQDLLCYIVHNARQPDW